ncbi:MAG: ATP-binding protein [Lachnospiraceae bacterium]
MNLQQLTGYLRQAIQKYNMIEDGDRIAVGLSGGKDSLALLMGLQKLAMFYPKKYELVAIYVDLGIRHTSGNNGDILFDKEAAIQNMEQFCSELQIPFYVVSTEIYDIVFEKKKEKHPCSLCSRMRKSALTEKANELNCTKIAYAHHMDDFIETSMMSLLVEGRYHCFFPVTKLEEFDSAIIRPMIFVPEYKVISFAKKYQLPVMKNPCPADGNTKRQEIKDWIKENRKQFPNIRNTLFSAVLKYFEEYHE